MEFIIIFSYKTFVEVNAKRILLKNLSKSSFIKKDANTVFIIQYTCRTN